MIRNKEKTYNILFFILIFFALILMFAKRYPAIVYNTDDWCFLTDTRAAYPIWKALNPCRVLPELLSPLATWISMTIVYPLTKDIINSLSFTTGIFEACFVFSYLLFFNKFIKSKLTVSSKIANYITVIFLIFHYLAFRKEDRYNQFAFYAISYTHVYFYTLPNVINAALVLYYVYSKTENKKDNAFFYLILYLALLSNLYSSITLPAYVAGEMVFDLFSKNNNRNFIARNKERLVLLALWMIVQAFEAFGGRASSLAGDSNFLNGVISHVSVFFATLYHNINHLFLFACLTIMAFGCVLLIKNKDKNNLMFLGKMLFAMVLSLIYIVLIATKAKATCEYFGVFFEVFFFAMIIVCFCLAYICRKMTKIEMFLPILVIILLAETNTNNETFRSAVNNSEKMARTIDNYLISEIIKADDEGKDYLKLAVPYFGGYDNFPLAEYGGIYISKLLNKYDFITQTIFVEFSPDRSLNERFCVK